MTRGWRKKSLIQFPKRAATGENRCKMKPQRFATSARGDVLETMELKGKKATSKREGKARI